MEDALAGKRLRERANLLHETAARDRDVVAQGLVPYVDRL
jgi:hypothetical protein